MNCKEGYIVCNSSMKAKMLLEERSTNGFNNYKYLSLEDLKRKLTFNVKKKGIVDLAIEYSLSTEVAKSYIDSLLLLNGSFLTDKGKLLKMYYDFLLSKGDIIIDKLFQKRARDFHYTFIGYDDNADLNYVLSLINDYEIVKPTSEPKRNLDINIFQTIEDEVSYVFSQISDLVKNGVCLEDIKICNANEDYGFILNRYSNYYNYPLTQNYGSNVLSTMEAKSLLSLLDLESFDLILDTLKSKFKSSDILDKIIDEINNYELYLYEPRKCADILKYILKNITFKCDHYLHEIENIGICEISKYSDKYIFLLNFNLDTPHILKDEEYLTDKEKDIMGITNSSRLNKFNKQTLINNLYSASHLCITFSYAHAFKSEIISPLYLELNMNPVERSFEFGYNKVSDDIALTMSLDKLRKYNEMTSLVSNYYKGFRYNSFDNKFKGIDANDFRANMKVPYTLSYTDMHSYLQCPFAYYCKRVLNIEPFKSTIDLELGRYAHGILEDFENENESFSFEASKENRYNEFVKDRAKEKTEITNKDLFYINKMDENVKLVIEQIKEHKKHTTLTNALTEEPLDVTLYDGKLLFKGFVDKLWYKNEDNTSYVAIIDYKTGNEVESLDNIENGENLQLPVYIYLVKNNARFKDSIITGFYLQKINLIKASKCDKTSLEQKFENFKIEGFTDFNYVDMIDDTKGTFLKKFKMKKDGTPDSRSKVFTQLDIKKLYEVVDEKIKYTFDHILDADFKITDKRINDKQISCGYCKFKDVCFKTSKDIVVLDNKPYGGDSNGKA